MSVLYLQGRFKQFRQNKLFDSTKNKDKGGTREKTIKRNENDEESSGHCQLTTYRLLVPILKLVCRRVGDNLCFIPGTLLSVSSTDCVCRERYFGQHCGIPGRDF